MALALLALAATLTITQLAGGDPAPATIPRDARPITLGASVGRAVPSGFLGLSIEYSSALNYFGTDPARVNPTFVQLVRNLDPGQSPVLRFGGDSTDWSWWPVPGVAKPGGVKITLDPEIAAMVRAAAQALNARTILGIQFEADSRIVAATEANQLLDRIGTRSVSALELGNEPEVYGALGWYANAAGQPVDGRPHSYDPAAFLADYQSIASALPSTVPLAGPATGAPRYQAAIGQFLASEPRVKTVTLHRYPLRRCHTAATSPYAPTIPHLLERGSSDGLAAGVAPTVGVAHAAGAKLLVDELNSVSCGGELGVSNTFAASLWSLDTLFALARVGVDGVDIHTFAGAWYEPFGFTFSGGVWHAQVTPLYYGMLAFADAAPPGAQILRVSAPADPTLRVWATRAPNRTTRVVLINESPRRATTISVPAPSGAGSATVSRLTAPSLAATSGVTLGGRAFATDTTTGQLAGTAATTTLTQVERHFVVTVPAASAAIVTIPPGQ